MRIVPEWLKNSPIAHRGLWGGDIAENSLTAYQNAVDNGFPIEIDLYETTDKEIVSFHDNDLERMTNGVGKIFDKSLTELKTLTLKGTENEKIPTLKEVLALVDGKVPLLIEIKKQSGETSVVENAIKILSDYKGEFAIQTFHPLYLKKVKKLAPHFIRGILATDDAFDQPFIKRLILKRMSLNFLIKPDFISYRYQALPLKKRKTKGKVVLAWTITDQQTATDIKGFADNIIFENFIPKV